MNQASIKNNIGKIHLKQHNFQKSLELFNDALKTLEAINYLSGYAVVLNNIGESLLNLCRYEEAEIHFNRALKIQRDTGGLHYEQLTRKNRVLLFKARGEIEYAIEEFRLALDIAKSLNTIHIEEFEHEIAELNTIGP